MLIPKTSAFWLLALTCVGVVHGAAKAGYVEFVSDYRNSHALTSDGNGVTPTHFPMTNAGTDPASGNFKVIGGKARHKPCCLTSAPGRVDCFFQEWNGNIFHWWKQGDTYRKEWINLGGQALDGVECVSGKTGIIDLLILDVGFRVYTKRYTATSGKWTNWLIRPSSVPLLDTPSCVRATSSWVECITRERYSRGYHFRSIDGRYNNWVFLRGWTGYPFKVSRRSHLITDYWAVAEGNKLYLRTLTSNNWGRFIPAGGPTVKGKPEAVSINENRIDVLISSTKDELIHFPWVNGAFQQWKKVGSPVLDAPACVPVGTTLQCFFVGNDAYLYRVAYDGTNWTQFFSSYGTFIEGPSCTLTKANEVSCYLRGFDRAIVEMIYTF